MLRSAGEERRICVVAEYMLSRTNTRRTSGAGTNVSLSTRNDHENRTWSLRKVDLWRLLLLAANDYYYTTILFQEGTTETNLNFRPIGTSKNYWCTTSNDFAWFHPLTSLFSLFLFSASSPISASPNHPRFNLIFGTNEIHFLIMTFTLN
jgi:hypothetical protein